MQVLSRGFLLYPVNSIEVLFYKYIKWWNVRHIAKQEKADEEQQSATNCTWKDSCSHSNEMHSNVSNVIPLRIHWLSQ